jgi:hypothetical protein
MPVERGNLGNDLGQDHSDRTGGTGYQRQDSRDGTVSTGRPDRQPGQVSLERTEMKGLPGHDHGVREAAANVA